MDIRQLAKAAAGKLHLLTEDEKRILLQEIEELEQEDAKNLAQNNFMAFVRRMWPGFIPGKHHEVVAKAFENVVNGHNKRLIINMAPRHAIMTSMMIPTTKGWKSMLDLRIGDFVFGPDGKPTQVLGKSEVFEGRDLYEVKTDDGATLTVDGEHLWTVRLNRRVNVYRDYTTEQLWRRQNGEVLRTKRSGDVEFVAGKTQKNPRLPRLPDVRPVEYERKELLIDPYVFGVWLGDGHSSQAVITMENEDAKIVRAEIERRGYKTTDQSTKMTFGILGLKVKLRELGVLGDKHIPSNYLEGSPDQRRDLLKGLMDTDGCVSKAGQCSFAQSNRFIIDDVRELLASLGIKNSLSVTEAKIGQKSYGPTYRISFYAKDIAILPRKEDRTKQVKETFGRYISIKRLEQTGNTQCIKVAREDGLFLAGSGYICTHNTKSEFASYLLPAWFLGKNPNKKIIQTSHTAELAVGFGRKVRNLINSEEYNQVFNDVKLKADNKSAGRWATNKGGEYFSIGVGGSVTGKGADLLIIDDPHSEQEAKLAAHKPDIFDAVYEWYTSGPRQRLQPGGAIIIVMCMTGDTPVLMADGTEKPLGAIRKNDLVATFDKGLLTTSKVNNWQSSGVDAIHKIQTRSGKILRANKKHPFLVMNEGVLEWTRLEQLRVGDLLVSLKGAAGRQGQKQNLACAGHVNQKKATTEETLMHHAESLGITENGKAKRVLKKVARSLFTVMGCATTITQKNIGLRAEGAETQNQTGRRGLNLDTGLLSINTMQWLQSAITNAMYAVSPHQQKIHAPIGMGNCALTTATILERFEGSCVTTATLQSGMEKHQAYLKELHRISDFTVDPIISIDYDGQEEVFDVEIDRTENFIANGVVSHNTRWSLRDLTGQVIKASQTRGGDEWEVIELPAIMPSGKPVWPEFWKLEELLALKEELPVGKWNAQYQQQPTAEEGAIVKREWWKRWESDRPPPCDFVIQSWDTAFLKHNRADFSACTTWGVWTTEEGETNIILLDAFKDRYEFPELKQKAYETYREWEPDVFLVEAKAAGSPLVFELRRMGIPVSEYSPTKGNDKIVRLNAVSDLFASGRIWVPERKFADELIEEVAAFPSGEHDDLCLVGETMITMADGSLKRIDEIRIGEMVATPEGPCKVIDAKCTGKHETIKLNIGNTSLQITPNHPVATQRGWIPAGQINPTDAILMLSNTGGLSWDLRLKGFKSRLLSLMGIGTAGIPEQNNLAIGSIFQGQTVYCTGTSGNFIMAPYQQAIKFTTKTGTHQIIDWKTWSALASKTTGQNTQTNIPPAEKQSFSKSILKVSGTWPQRGIAVQKVSHGIRSTPKEASLSEIQTGELRNTWLAGNARFAQNFLRAITLERLFVPQLARLRSETISCAMNSLTSLTSVCAATLNSLRFKPKRSTVVESAIKPTIVSAEDSLVYNLTVDRASCYFANGVLVHNCDSMTQALLRFRTGGFLNLQSDDEDREPIYRRKVTYY